MHDVKLLVGSWIVSLASSDSLHSRNKKGGRDGRKSKRDKIGMGYQFVVAQVPHRINIS